MSSFQFSMLSSKARLVGAVVAFAASACNLVAVLSLFASAPRDVDVRLAKARPAGVASAVAAKERKPAPG